MLEIIYHLPLTIIFYFILETFHCNSLLCVHCHFLVHPNEEIQARYMYQYLFEIVSLFSCVHIEMKSETMLEWKLYDSMITYYKVSLFIYFVYLIKPYTIYVYINLLLHYIIM